jgi:hypothetical protein
MRNLCLPILLMLAGCAGGNSSNAPTASLSPVLPASAHKLTGKEIEQKLSGNSVRSADNYTEFFTTYGSIRGAWKGGGRYTGSWRIDGDNLCSTYPDYPQYSGCEGVAIDGDQVYYLNSDGSVKTDYPKPDTLVTGDPDNL